MRRRLSLETLESRITPTTLGTVAIDASHLAVSFTAATTSTPTAPTAPLPAGTVALQPPSANSATGLIATLGSFSAPNGSDSYSIASAVQGSTLTVSVAGNGPMALSVLDVNGNVLAQQGGSGPISLNLGNLPASGGVTVVVTAANPTGYLLTSLLAAASTGTPSTPTTPPASTGTPSTPTTPPASTGTPSTPTTPPASTGTPSTPTTPPASTGTPSTPTTPPATAPVTGTGTLSTGTLDLPLLDPDGLPETPPVVTPNPLDLIYWEWTALGNITLYDPLGTPINPWSPPAGYGSPSGLPINPTPPPPPTGPTP